MAQSDEHKKAFLKELPKCEHHIHIEGSLEPELIFELAKKKGIALPDSPEYASVAALHERYERFTSLDDFLAYYFRGMDVLTTDSDFESLAYEYFKRAHHDGVYHAEVFFDPQVHKDRGISLETVVSGLEKGAKKAQDEFGITSKLIMCFLKHLPFESADELYNEMLASDYIKEARIHGLGASSSEVGPPKDLFRDIYKAAQKHNIALTAHAGEEGDASYIHAALEMGATRIDHGIHIVEDKALMEHAAKEKILLSVCPLSNVKLKVVNSVSQVPIRTLLDAGIPFSLNSDDPSYFGGYILDNYYAVEDAFKLSISEWETIARNSILGSWVDDARKSELNAAVTAVVDKYTPLLK